jgi:hypothetical protein
VRSIWRFCRYGQSTPNDDRAGNVERRLHSVGDQHVSVTDHAGHDLNRRKHHIYDETKERDTRTGSRQ